ncbi:MAG: hypothetical protein KDI33_17525, partial [Halioglobus sp.]|nr:hypothetical protein [Halioglobus sp.]
MSLASDKLATIREQVQYHLDHTEQTKLTAEQEQALKEEIKEMLLRENAVIVAHYYTSAVQGRPSHSTGFRHPSRHATSET